MDGSSHEEEGQAAMWNGAGGRSWVDAQAMLDRMFEPFEELLVETVLSKNRTQVLDVGCGTGGTTLAVARRLAAQGRCVGVDISQPMIEHARRRAAAEEVGVSFVCADAESHPFERDGFDMVVSRFGVMFFQDPVGAFANLRSATRDGAELCAIVWRGPGDNPFMTTAERAAASVIPNVPPRQVDAPGQFGLADPIRVRRMLEHSGWTSIDITPIDVECQFPTTALDRYLTRLGPLGRLLTEADEQTKARVLTAVRPAFDEYVHGESVRFRAACWVIGARNARGQ